MFIHVTLFLILMLIKTPIVCAVLIDFEDVPQPPGVFIPASSVDSGGFNFSDPFGFHLGLENNFDGAFNGTTILFVEAKVTMRRIDGSSFSLLSFDFGEDFGTPGIFDEYAKDLTVTGALVGGGTVVAHFTLDGLFDGSGGIADFQSGTLIGFTHLASVAFSGSGGSFGSTFALDNLSVSAVPVPEPSSLMLLALGTPGLAVKAWRRRRSIC